VKIKKFFILITFAILFSLLLPATNTAQGQGEIELKSVTARLYPEFVKPSVYTIFEIELPEDVTLPQVLIIQIPAHVHNTYVGYLDQEGHLFSLEAVTAIEDDWKKIQIITPTRQVHIAYEHHELQFDGENRTYLFEWRSNYSVQSFNLQVHMPDQANIITADPELGSIMDTEGDINFYALEEVSLPAEVPFKLDLWYAGGESDYSSPTYKVEAIGEINENTAGRTPRPLNLIIWFITVSFSLILLVGSHYFLHRKIKTNEEDRTLQGVGIMNPERQVVFCHECGMRSRPGDTYCGNCGTELRKIPPFK
jgi:hypothetical protein